MDVFIGHPFKCIDCIQKCHLIIYTFECTSSCTVAGLLTSFGLDLLAGILAGPKVDRATLQLVG
eukprot:1753959-Amphidinium_carterae.1